MFSGRAARSGDTGDAGRRRGVRPVGFRELFVTFAPGKVKGNETRQQEHKNGKTPLGLGFGHPAGGAGAAALRGDPLLRRRRDQRREPDRPALGHVGLRDALHGALRRVVEHARGVHHRQHPRLGLGDPHPAAHRCHRRHVDGLGRRADDDLLRTEDSAPLVLPGRLVRDLRRGVAHDGQLVDHDRHDRRGAHGHRQRHGLSRGVGGRCDHLGRLLRRQGLAALGHDGARLVDRRGADLHPHPLHAPHDHPVVRHRPGGLHRGGADARARRRHACRELCRGAACDVPHHAVAAARAAGHRSADRAQAPGHHHALRCRGAGLRGDARGAARAGGPYRGGRVARLPVGVQGGC